MAEAEWVIHLEHADILQNENLILREVNLDVRQGEFIYLVGKTGSGKSSLLKTLYAELPLRNGIGQCCGYDLTKIKRRQVPYLRRKLGIVFQDFELLTDRSVNDNLEFVLRATGWTDKKAMASRMEHVLQLVGLDTKGYKMPHALSGGEQQRVAIARALLNTPHLLLADEPTGNLDPQTSLEILNLLLAICSAGTAVLMASHDYETMRKFNSRIMVCDDTSLREVTEINHAFGVA
ncbi:MAG: ATP-binding cassette domain-containing protein [Flavobacteriales bacterium]|nr:ATP-binding cassette domain-containing protein [Flavobacteriales bacterium]